MHDRFRKIQAFTLGEMIVVLLITTIVVSTAFSVLRLVQRQMNGMGENYGRNTELNLLRQALWIDFNRSNGVYYEANKGELWFSNELDHQIYTLGEDFVIKERDTFYITWETQRFLFENREIHSGEIDALDFRTTQDFGSQQIFVYKRNSATTYMNEDYGL